MTLSTSWADNTGQSVNAAYLNALDTQVNTNTTDITNLKSRTVTGATSLTGGGDLTANRTLSLVGDAATPGNSMLYGTNGSGVKGWYAQPSGGGGGVPTTRNINTTNSLTGGGDLSADRTLQLVGDAASPGNSTYYGTDSSGSKGYHALPSGSTNNNDVGVINVLDYGADRTGATASDTAFLNAFTAAVAHISNTYSQDYRTNCVIKIPPGTYLLQGSGMMIPQLSLAGVVSGILFQGGGVEATMIVFNPTSANSSLMNNQDQYYHLTFRDLSFYCTGTNAATATIFNSLSNGHAQNYRFERVNFSGTAQYGLKLSGNNNNSEMVFDNVGMHLAMPSGAFLYSPTVAAGGTEQWVDYNFDNCNIEWATGDFIQMGSGGRIGVKGGSWIMAGDGTGGSPETTSTHQNFIKVLQNPYSGAGFADIHLQDGRLECRHDNGQLINSSGNGWDRGEIVVDNVDCETDAWLLGTPQNVHLFEFGSTSGGGSGPGTFPNIDVRSCFWFGTDKYHYNANSYVDRSAISYRKTEFVGLTSSYSRATDFFSFIADDSTTITGGLPLIEIVGCKSTYAGAQSPGYIEVFDTWLNWRTAVNKPIAAKRLFMRMPTGGLPGPVSTTEVVNLPINSIIKRVQAYKTTTGGTSTSTSVQYALTDGASTNIATATTTTSPTNATLKAWNTTWAYDSGMLTYDCSSNTTRALTLTQSGLTTETSTAAFFEIEYVG